MNIHSIPAFAAAAVANHPGRAATTLAHDCADVRVVVFRIEPGQQVPVHTSPSSVVLMIVSGGGIVVGAAGEREVRAGDMVTYDPKEPHGMRATVEPLVIAAVIAPGPAA